MMMCCKEMGSNQEDHPLGQHPDCVPPSPGLVPMPRWSKTIKVEKSEAWQQSKVQFPQHVENPWIAHSPGSSPPRSILDGRQGAHSQTSSLISAFHELASRLPISTHPSSKASAHHFPAARANCSPSVQSIQWLATDGHADSNLRHAQSLALAGYGLSRYTTVVIHRLPFKYSQKKFVDEIHEAGFEGTYDFLYLPANARSHGIRGFGFINFLSSCLAEAFYRRYQGQKLKEMDKHPLAIIPSDAQGFEQSVERYFSCWQLRSTKQCRDIMPVFYKPVPI